MSSWLIIAVGLVYAYIAVDNFLKGNISMGVVFAGYAFSNYGLYRLSV
jgi:hypothetical protein